MKTPALLLLASAFLSFGCQTDRAMLQRQQSVIERQEQMLVELKDTMDEQGEVIVEQIKMMAEMQQTIDRQRVAMKETSESLRLCSQRL